MIKIINDDESLSLEAIGLLALIYEQEKEDHFQYSFSDRQTFLEFFRLDSLNCERIFGELIDKGIVKRRNHNGFQIYKLSRITIKVPIKFSRHFSIESYEKYKLDKFDLHNKNKLNQILKTYKNLLLNIGKDYNTVEIDKFFNLFKKFEKIIPEFYITFKRINSTDKGLNYYRAILLRLQANDKSIKQTVSDSLKWDDSSMQEMEKQFALKLITGEAHSRRKYETLVKQKNFEELRRLYALGLTLNDQIIPFTNYDWLENS